MSMMIDVSIAIIYSEVYFDYFLSFFSFSSSFVRWGYFFTFVYLFWLSMFLRTKSYVFWWRHGQLYDCKLGILDWGLNFKMAGLWRYCDVMTRHNWHVISPICQANAMLKTCQVSSQELWYFLRSIGGWGAQKLKKSPGRIRLNGVGILGLFLSQTGSGFQTPNGSPTQTWVKCPPTTRDWLE